jgi:DNA-binding transcriptional regulator GbsR (MarR family)
MTDEGVAAPRETVIESMERSAEVYGLSRSAGRVYGVLYFTGEPLSIPELVERTGYAKSTISTVTRRLDRLGVIRRRSSRGGGRRVQFEAEADIWFILQDVLQQHLQREMQASIRSLDRAAEDLSDLDETDASRSQLEKIREIRRTYEELQKLTELATQYSASELVEAISQYADQRDED